MIEPQGKPERQGVWLAFIPFTMRQMLVLYDARFFFPFFKVIIPSPKCLFEFIKSDSNVQGIFDWYHPIY